MEYTLKSSRFNPVIQQSASEYVNSSLRWKFHKIQGGESGEGPEFFLSKQEKKLPVLKSHGTQTVKRESEAQTDPFSAKLKAPHSELEALSSLKWGAGLPSNIDEYEVIRQMLKKKQAMDTLPQHNPKMQMAIMRDLEVEEAKFKAHHGQKMIQRKIDMMTEDLKRKTDQRQIQTEERIREYQKKKEESIQLTKEKIQRRKNKFFMALIERKKVQKNELSKKIQAYHVALVEGAEEDHPDRLLVADVLKQQIIDNEKALLETINSTVVSQDTHQAAAKKRMDAIERLLQPSTSSYKMLQEKRWNKKLDHIAKEYQEEDAKKKEDANLRYLIAKDAKEQRPQTSHISVIKPEEEETMETRVLIVQRILRGINVKLEMQNAIDKNTELLLELATKREVENMGSLNQLSKSLAIIPPKILEAKKTDEGSSNAVAASSQNSSTTADPSRPRTPEPKRLGSGVQVPVDILRSQTLASYTAAKQVQKQALKSKESEQAESTRVQSAAQDTAEEAQYLVDEIFDDLFEAYAFAPYIGRSLDYLEKDLVRQRELINIIDIIDAAKAVRYEKERIESEKRKAELEIRVKVNDIYRQIMDIHDETTITFIEGICEVALKEKASEVASYVQIPYDIENENVEEVLLLLKEFMYSEAEKQLDDTIETEPKREALISYAVNRVLSFS